MNASPLHHQASSMEEEVARIAIALAGEARIVSAFGLCENIFGAVGVGLSIRS